MFMFGIFSLVVGLGLRGACAIHDYIDNQETIKRTTRVMPDGTITHFDNEYRFYRNGELVYKESYKDINGKYHEREIGMNTKKVYSDSFEEKCKEYYAENQRQKEQAISRGEKAYMAWHPNTPYAKQHVTEISTGKVIKSIMRDRWGNAQKMYAKEPERLGWTDDIVEGDGVWIPISAEEFKALNICPHDISYVTNFYTKVDRKPGENYMDLQHRLAAERIDEIYKKGGGLPHLKPTKYAKYVKKVER